MARTRLEIKTLVESHTARTKDTLESSLCDTALKEALMRHPFNDAISTPSDLPITEDATSVDISATSAFNIVTARIVEADGPRNTPLIIKNRTWWDLHVINPEDNAKCWPSYGLHAGNYIHFNAPVISGLELRLRVTTEQVFATDSTVCPIACLDVFVEHYVTYGIFLDLGIHDRAIFWKIQAMGPKYDIGEIGGSLKTAIDHDSKEIGEDLAVEPRGSTNPNPGLAILNDNSGHPRYGEVDMWY